MLTRHLSRVAIELIGKKNPIGFFDEVTKNYSVPRLRRWTLRSVHEIFTHADKRKLQHSGIPSPAHKNNPMALAHRKASFSCLRSCSQTRAGLSFPVHHQQVRHATLIRRPKRPYTFTQLVTLSDGSTYIQRSTSPIPIYKSSKDLKNTPLWNPSSQKLMNREEDEAGRLRLFRQRFGRGWDAETAETAEAKEVRDFCR